MNDLRLLQARWTLGLVRPEDLPPVAAELLQAGVDTPSLRVLAGEGATTAADSDPLIERVFQESKHAPLSREAAGAIVLRDWARRIRDGESRPYDGAKGIWSEVCDPLADDGPWFVFKSLASEHEDYRFAQETAAPGTYDDSIEACEVAIVARAAELLAAEEEEKDPTAEEAAAEEEEAEEEEAG